MVGRLRDILIVSLAAVPTPMLAGVRVVDDQGQDVPATAWAASQDVPGGDWTIELTDLWNPWGSTWFEVAVDSGESIARLTIDVDGPPAGSPVIVTVGRVGSPVHRIDVIEQTGTAEVILHEVNAIMSLGRVEVQAINTITVIGSVEGPIIATTGPSTSRGLRQLSVVGDLLGDVIIQDGVIRDIAVIGDIGTMQSPVRIEAGAGLWSLSALGDCRADIDLCANGNAGFLYRLSVDAFEGNLTIDRFDRPPGVTDSPRLHCGGAFSGSITITEALDDPDVQIELAASGLQGQIIINAAATPGGGWNTPVLLASGANQPALTLTGPTYEELPAMVGGGSVGLVPYRMHASACQPPDGSVVVQLDAVVLNFFGPLAIGWGSPLAVHRRLLGTQDAWLGVAGSEFEVTLSESDPRQLIVRPSGSWSVFQAGYEYRFTPTDSLLCADPINLPVSVEVSTTIGIEPNPCVGDVDLSGWVDVVDILLVLALWGQWGSAAAEAADVTGDGVVSVEDLLAVIGHYGPC